MNDDHDDDNDDCKGRLKVNFSCYGNPVRIGIENYVNNVALRWSQEYDPFSALVTKKILSYREYGWRPNDNAR